MSHVHEGPLATYSSLMDPHLSGYFSNTHIRRHLRKSKLISRKGEVITESKYRLLNARANHRKQVREMLAEAIVHKTLDMERLRQAEIRHRLDKIAKIEMVKKVRAERKFGYEDTIMDLLRPPSEVRRRRRDSGRSCESLPQLASSRTGGSSRTSGGSQRRTSKRAVDDGRRSSAKQRSHSHHSSASRSRSYSEDMPRSGSRGKRRGSDSSTTSFGSMSSESTREGHHIIPHREESQERGSKSAYDKGPPVAWKPHPPPKKPVPNTPRDEHGRPIKSKKHVRGRVILHRQEPAFKHEKEVQTFCEVTLKYLGGAYSQLLQQQIIVEQQHCGGNTLTVFKEYVKPKSKFSFTSKRHRGYPFGLTLYIDGHQDSTVSTCCEYKHRKGTLLGSKSSHFLFVSVSGAQPCYKCQVEAELSSKAKEDKEKRDERKKAEEDAAEEDDYGDDFEGSDAEKEVKYEDDFDGTDKQSLKSDRSDSSHGSRHSDRSPDSDRRAKSRLDRSDEEEEKTAREVKSYEDELEPKTLDKSSKALSPKSRNSRKTGNHSPKNAVEIAVHDSDEEKEDGISARSEKSDRSTKSSHSRKSDKSSDSHHSHRSAQSKHSSSSVHSVKSEPSARSPEPPKEVTLEKVTEETREDDNVSVKSEKSDSSTNSKRSNKSTTSSGSESSKKSATSDISARSKKSDASDKSASSKKSDASDKSTSSKKSDASDKSESSKKSDASDKSTSSKKSEKSTSSSSSEATVKSSSSSDTIKRSTPVPEVVDGKEESPIASSKAVVEAPIEDNGFYTISTALTMECIRDSEGRLTVNKRTTGSMKELIQIIKVNRDLTKLTLPECSLDDTEVDQLMQALVQSGSSLQELDLSGNKFGLKGGLAVTHALVPAKKTSLLHLRLNNTGITELALTELLIALEKNNVNMISLYLDGCIENGGILSADGASAISRIISKERPRLRQLSVSHISSDAVKQICGAISHQKMSMKFLGFSSIYNLHDVTICPLLLTAGTNIHTLSLVHNNLTDGNIKAILKQWNVDKPTITDILIEPGNDLVTDACKSKLKSFLRGLPADTYMSSSETSDSESEMSSSMQSRSSTPLVTKPPLPPRKASLQSSVSSKSELESENAELEKGKSEKESSEKSESTKTGSEKAESEEAETNKEKVKMAESKRLADDKSVDDRGADNSDGESSFAPSSLCSENEDDSDFSQDELGEPSKPRVTLTSTDEETTPRVSTYSNVKHGEDNDDDIIDITATIPADASVKDVTKSSKSEIKLAGLTKTQVEELCEVIKSNKKLKVIKIQDTDLSGSIRQLSDSLKKNKVLEELVLSGCSLTRTDSSSLAALVKQHTSTLRVLSLRNNAIGDPGCAAIIKEFSSHAQDAYNFKIQRQAKELVNKSLAASVQAVYGQDAVKSDSLVSIATLGSDTENAEPLPPLIDPPTLQTLILSNSKLGNATIDQIVKLIQCGEIKDLRVASSGNITYFGWKDLLTTLTKENCSLSSLDISSNPDVGGAGVATRSPLLAIPGVKLDYLNMSGCHLLDEHVERLSQEFRTRHTRIGEFILQPGNRLSTSSMETLTNSCRG